MVNTILSARLTLLIDSMILSARLTSLIDLMGVKPFASIFTIVVFIWASLPVPIFPLEQGGSISVYCR